MSEDLLVRHCSPTLAGMKAGSMFPCAYDSQKELLSYIHRTNRILIPKGLRVLVLRCRQGRALLYVFRPSSVKKILQDEKAVHLLKKFGYQDLNLKPCLCHLLGRFRENGEFPHEVGLFLGYPPEDVNAFIENKAGNHKCVGCWKVYGDEDAARKTFEKYKKCTDVYCCQWAKGKSIERLTVAG